MEERFLKVQEAPGIRNDVPRILLQGKWLSNLGYQVGDRVKVSIQDHRLIIEQNPETDEVPQS